ncbi:MAG: pantoate--beta-alanine ligase [FCB group bacterium]|nr:pantoate--beta-alanine ligase [FCB group bacterium]
MDIVTKVTEWNRLRDDPSRAGKSFGFVPTMGAIHKGHLSLVQRCVAENDLTVVSIFVNPTQFNDPSDLESYPRTFDTDRALLEKAGVDFIFLPKYGELYPNGYRYKVIETDFSKKLCGAYRPGHFDGVLTVVMKLLNIIRAHRAYFGEKDYQQYQLIKGMAEAFFLKTEIVPCPIVREEDGLACSSRNTLLSPEERKIAPLFHQFLASNLPNDEIRERLEGAGFTVDYIEVIGKRRYGAVRLGGVRLIDNIDLTDG